MAQLYIREVSVERQGEEIALEAHFYAEIDDDTRILVDPSRIVTYRIDDGNTRQFLLRQAEAAAIANALEQGERSSIIAEAAQDAAEAFAAGYFDRL